jgi:hypothetical protein
MWREATKVAVSIFVPLRICLSALAAFLAWYAPSLSLPLSRDLMEMWAITVPKGPVASLLITPWLHFDALWFLKTVQEGYALYEPNIQHMVMFPLLTRIVHQLVGGHVAVSSLLVSNVAFIGSLMVFYRLAMLDYDENTSRLSTLVLAIFPTSFFYLTGYSESLLLLGILIAFYYARQRHWFAAGIGMTVATLSRPQGILLLIPIGIEFVQQEIWPIVSAEPEMIGAAQYGNSFRRIRFWLRRGWEIGHSHYLKAIPFIFPVVGLAGYLAFFDAKFGLGPVFRTYQGYWQLEGKWFPGLALWRTIEAIVNGIFPHTNAVDLAFALFGVAMALWALRTLRPSYGIFMVVTLLGVMSRPVLEHPLTGISRYILALFPMYMLLGWEARQSPVLRRVVQYGFFALLLFFAGQYSLGGWVG